MPTIPKATKVRRAVRLDYPTAIKTPVRTIRLEKAALTDAETAKLCAHLLGDSAYDVLIADDADVYRPDGSLLSRLRQGVLSETMCREAFPVWADAARPTNNRGYAGGVISTQQAAD